MKDMVWEQNVGSELWLCDIFKMVMDKQFDLGVYQVAYAVTKEVMEVVQMEAQRSRMVIVMMRVIKDCWAGYGCYSDGSGRAG